MIKQNNYIPDYISVTQMARLLNLSRSRFYQLISEQILLPPIYSLANKRPFYSEEMAKRNIEVKRNNVGINGQIIIFYSPKNNVVHGVNKVRTAKTKPRTQTNNRRYIDLIDGLEALGMTDVKSSQIEAAVADCFPNGTEKVDEDEMLRTVFRHLRRRNTEHKQRT